MPVIEDKFPAPSLDPDRWTSIENGSVSVVIGVPEDGVFPQNVDDIDDAVTISSQEKLIIPGLLDFDVRIFYEDVFTDVSESIVSFLGWRSTQLDNDNESSYGVDVLLCVKPAPDFVFQRHTIVSSVENRSTITPDVSVGGDGGFRVVRSGFNYKLYRFDAEVSNEWELLSTEIIPHAGPGFIVFGIFAEDPLSPGFPWVFQT